MAICSHILLVSFLVALVTGQACENYGTQNGSGCACPPGFGGSTCAQPSCGGDIFQGSQRGVSSGGNVTGGSCACEGGWIGTGCNVCQNAGACQDGYTKIKPNTGAPSLPGQSGQNDTLVCNTSPRVYAANQMSCQVINPTLQALFPLPANLNMLRTLEPNLTPIPNTTAFGSAGSALGQLFYGGVEQFYCKAESCQQQSDNATSYSCKTLSCTCKPGTTFCGAPGSKADLTSTINALVGPLEVSCAGGDNSSSQAKCDFKQAVLQSLFGKSGLSLTSCVFGECVRQSVIDTAGHGNSSLAQGGKQLSGGVIAGLAVVGSLVGLALALLVFGWTKQKKARAVGGAVEEKSGGVSVEWTDVSYVVPRLGGGLFGWWMKDGGRDGIDDDKVVLDNVSGKVLPGQIMAILGPSGAGKTTLVEILAGKAKSGLATGSVSFPSTTPSSPNARPRIGFVPQQDILPPMLTVAEALLFAARLRLPESVPDSIKQHRVDSIMEKLGISGIRNVRIGDTNGGRGRGISGGEMRRVSIGLELVARPDVLILDEPTSGLDSVSASKVANVLHAVAHDPENPTAVIASIHQPSSQLYQTFDSILLLSHGRALYSGAGSFAPAQHFAQMAPATIHACPKGYNVADYLLEVASDPPVALFQMQMSNLGNGSGNVTIGGDGEGDKHALVDASEKGDLKRAAAQNKWGIAALRSRSTYAATFLTQLQVLSGREWKVLRRDKTLFLTHIAVSMVLGVFCGGLYYKTDVTIAGFQSRVGCLFFLGALIAFSSLSALYNIVEIRPLFLRERSSSYFSPTAWLLSRFFFDVVPLRIIPTIIVSTITYWMARLAQDAAHFFKFLFILVLYTLVMTLYNFFLGTLFRNGGIAILLSALSALYQMTFAGFFVHLNDIPPVLRWLQWLCPLKYTLEALSVNEVDSGLMIQDKLQGVPVNVSASLIMNLLFGFEANNYYRDVLVLFGYIAAFALGVIGVVWLKVRERR